MVKHILLILLFCFLNCETELKKKPEIKKLNFFREYYKTNKIVKNSDSLYYLNLTVDLHYADCGAPDCYGTELKIKLNTHVDGYKCILDSTSISTKHFFDKGCTLPIFEADTVEHKYRYISEEVNLDLNDSTLPKITLRNENGPGAITLLKDKFFYYEQAKRGDSLIQRLENDDDTVSPNIHFGFCASNLHSIKGL